ncbi:hypothetical protein [Aquimarina agarilytica]|uniref:hypothetical protein n=1 Tax=Aquimarina agarilytica TaxID=1087449 RepID=UPI00028993D4|nr:hypothetical protein [Aquimarina agarilytica]
MKIKFLITSAVCLGMAVSCSTDEITDVDNTGELTEAELRFRKVDLSNPRSFNFFAAKKEALTLLKSIKLDGGEPFNVKRPAVRYTRDQNVFVPSAIGIDFRIDRNVVPQGPTVRLPMFTGWETTETGRRKGHYVITETSNRFISKLLGVAFAPRMANARGSDGVQLGKFTRNGRLVFEGSVDFSPKRSLVAGVPGGGLLSFPPAEANAGAIADDNWSSYVVLPSGLVINAQLVANDTGIHDRIPALDTSIDGQDDFNSPFLSKETASVVLQLLDGWHDGRDYYFHIVTDTSDPGPAAIEKGVFAPKLNNIPAFGEFPGGAFLGFSPCANGNPERDAEGNIQGLNVAIDSEDQNQDPTNTFPIDPSDDRFSPMWDAHICEWAASVPENERPILRSIAQIEKEIANGRLGNFRGNNGPVNPFIAGLMPTRALINCPVITQPVESAIGTIVGEPMP